MTSKVLEQFAPLAISRPYFDYQRNLVRSVYPEEVMQASWFRECCHKPMFVYGTRYLDRQIARSGEYILFPNDIRELGDVLIFEEQISPLSKDHEAVVGRCIISPTCKKAIVDELRGLGITEGSLFPDSIEKVCADIVCEVKHR